MLFHDRLVAKQRRSRAERIVETNLGFAGGKDATDVILLLDPPVDDPQE